MPGNARTGTEAAGVLAAGGRSCGGGAAAQEHGTCGFVGGYGNSNVHPEIVAVVELHDRRTKAAVGNSLIHGGRAWIWGVPVCWWVWE